MRRNILLRPVPMLAAGLILGTAARIFDIYCPNLGEIFSQMAVWILIGTLIAIYSPTKKAAMGNILPFCRRMMLTYYATAMLTHGVYSWSYILGWTIFALFSPGMAYFAWMSKQRGAFQNASVRESCWFRRCPAYCFLTGCAYTTFSSTVC